MRLDFGAKIIDFILVSDRVPWLLYFEPVVGTRKTDKTPRGSDHCRWDPCVSSTVVYMCNSFAQL